MEQLALFDELTLDGKIKRSIDVIKLAAEMSEQYYKKPLLVCYSGGKDSDVLLDLVKRSGVPFEVIYSLTTADAPPTVQHIKQVFSELQKAGIHTTIKHPTLNGEPITMWRLIPLRQMPPTMKVRYCCRVLKETTTPNRLIALGVRAPESHKRVNTKEFEIRGKTVKDALRYTFDHVLENYGISQEHAGEENGDVWDCKIISNAKANNDIISNPIAPWTDGDVWDYIKQNNVVVNPLYSMGFKRVGCVGCPYASKETHELEYKMFPQYKQNYIKAFDRMIEHRKAQGLPCVWKDGNDVFAWWVGDQPKDDEQIEGQETLF